jgi:hypothetical protein
MNQHVAVACVLERQLPQHGLCLSEIRALRRCMCMITRMRACAVCLQARVCMCAFTLCLLSTCTCTRMHDYVNVNACDILLNDFENMRICVCVCVCVCVHVRVYM